MNVTSPITFHIGYHKTATSWMQQRLFTSEHGYAPLADHAEVFQHIVQPHGLHFDPQPLRDLLTTRRTQMPEGATPIVSSEVISGHPFQGGHESDVYAERIARIAPDARILISIRAQIKILPSVYMQYLLRGGTMPPAQFYQGTNEPGYFGFTPRHFEYDLLVAHYQKLFGEDRVHVLTQESIRTDMDAAAQTLATFTGNKQFTTLSDTARMVYAASYPEYAVPVLRRLNHVQSSTLNPNPIVSFGKTPQGLYRGAGYLLRRPPLSNLLKTHRPVTDYVQKTFANYYKDSNARLAAQITHPLDLAGYH
jgi:hypothetical protein